MKTLAALALVTLLAGEARAGRRAFIWTWDTETAREGDIELEQWQWIALRELGNGRKNVYWIWWSPILGLTDNLELAVPFEFKSAKGGFAWNDVVLELRYRIVDPPPENAPAFPWSLAVRGAVQQDVAGGRQLLTENLIVALGRTEGMHFTVDLGLNERARISGGPGLLRPLGLSLGAGGTSKPFGPLRFGGELFAEYRITPRPVTAGGQPSGYEDHLFIGPNVAYAKGRVWATLGWLFGLTDTTPDAMVRLIIAVAI